MFKNVASQKIALFAFDTTTGAAKTGDGANITPYVSKDYGTVTVLGTTTATEMDSTNAKGWYSFVLTQGETNGDALLFTAKSSTANVSIVGSLLFTTISSNIKKNAASRLSFTMTDSTNHNPATGATVSGSVSIDGAAFTSLTNTPATEISNGDYTIALAAADTNGNSLLFRFTATSCDDVNIFLLTQP